VVGALLIREIYSRFGRESVGFAWIVAEPLVSALPFFAGDRLEPHRLIVSFVVFHILGAVDVPRDLLMFYVGYFYGLVGRCDSLDHRCAERGQRMGATNLDPLLVSVHDSLGGLLARGLGSHPAVRTVAPYQPYTQAYEMIRAGVVGTTIRTYGDPIYTTCVLAILTLLGLWLLREGHRYVVAE
jgi:hypothetical protein